MTKLFELLLLGAVLPLLAAPTLNVRRFIAPLPAPDSERQALPEETGNSPANDDGSGAETSPLEILAVRPDAPQAFPRFVRPVQLGKPLQPAAPPKLLLRRVENSIAVRLERRVVESRCVATSLAVVAPPVRRQAPPRPLT